MCVCMSCVSCYTVPALEHYYVINLSNRLLLLLLSCNFHVFTITSHLYYYYYYVCLKKKVNIHLLLMGFLSYVEGIQRH